jgi:hypothetical protein
VIEVVVAKAFLGRTARDGHTPAAPGGDTVYWFYSKDGTTAGCPVMQDGITPLQPVDAGGQ